VQQGVGLSQSWGGVWAKCRSGQGVGLGQLNACIFIILHIEFQVRVGG